VHYEDPLTFKGPLHGPGALAEHAARLRTAAPDARLESSGARLTDGRFVAAPVRLLATHTGEYGNFPPTGRAIVVQAVFYCELDQARTRLWRIRAFFDLYDAAIQLGVLPKPGSVGERALLLLRGFGLRG
jgi:predicted ester cyclase